MTREKRSLTQYCAAYTPFLSTTVAETVQKHITITAFDTVGAEISAHLIFVAGIYGLTLIDTVLRALRIVVDFIVQLPVSFLIFLVIRL